MNTTLWNMNARDKSKSNLIKKSSRENSISKFNKNSSSKCNNLSNKVENLLKHRNFLISKSSEKNQTIASINNEIEKNHKSRKLNHNSVDKTLSKNISIDNTSIDGAIKTKFFEKKISNKFIRYMNPLAHIEKNKSATARPIHRRVASLNIYPNKNLGLKLQKNTDKNQSIDIGQKHIKK